jgi:hypothetical protein
MAASTGVPALRIGPIWRAAPLPLRAASCARAAASKPLRIDPAGR